MRAEDTEEIEVVFQIPLYLNYPSLYPDFFSTGITEVWWAPLADSASELLCKN